MSLIQVAYSWHWLIGILLVLSAFTGCQRRAVPTSTQPPATIDAARLEALDAEKHQSPAPQATSDTLPALSIVLIFKRTGCFGKCPVFEVRIYDNRRATYHGMMHTARLGWHETEVSEAWIAELKAAAAKIAFFNLEDFYPAGSTLIPDLPSTFTTISMDGYEKTVHNNFDAPQALIELENWLEAAIDRLPWQPSKRD
jgi:hypothetical protein